MLEPKACRAQLGSASIVPHRPNIRDEKWTLKQVQGDGRGLQKKVPAEARRTPSGIAIAHTVAPAQAGAYRVFYGTWAGLIVDGVRGMKVRESL